MLLHHLARCCCCWRSACPVPPKTASPAPAAPPASASPAATSTPAPSTNPAEATSASATPVEATPASAAAADAVSTAPVRFLNAEDADEEDVHSTEWMGHVLRFKKVERERCGAGVRRRGEEERWEEVGTRPETIKMGTDRRQRACNTIKQQQRPSLRALQWAQR